MNHECQIEREQDPFAWREQYFITCKCHMGDTWITWRPGEPEFVCPQEVRRGTTNNMSPEDE